MDYPAANEYIQASWHHYFPEKRIAVEEINNARDGKWNFHSLTSRRLHPGRIWTVNNSAPKSHSILALNPSENFLLHTFTTPTSDTGIYKK